MRQGCTQEELAARCDMSRVSISNLERGKHEPGLSTIVRLAESLGVRPSELIEAFEIELQHTASST